MLFCWSSKFVMVKALFIFNATLYFFSKQFMQIRRIVSFFYGRIVCCCAIGLQEEHIYIYIYIYINLCCCGCKISNRRLVQCCRCCITGAVAMAAAQLVQCYSCFSLLVGLSMIPSNTMLPSHIC